MSGHIVRRHDRQRLPVEATEIFLLKIFHLQLEILGPTHANRTSTHRNSIRQYSLAYIFSALEDPLCLFVLLVITAHVFGCSSVLPHMLWHNVVLHLTQLKTRSCLLTVKTGKRNLLQMCNIAESMEDKWQLSVGSL